jgi:LPS export ABC transporter protein LptC
MTKNKDKIPVTNTNAPSSDTLPLSEGAAFSEGQSHSENEAFSGSHNGEDQFENLEPKTISFHKSTQNINLTKKVKIGLLSLTLLSLLALILWPILSSKENGFTLAVTTLPQKDEAAKFVGVEYRAVDSNGHPVIIRFDKAYQETREDVNYHIKNLRVEAVLSTGKPVKINAAKGVYLQEERKIHFKGKVHILAGDDYNIKTDEAIFMIDEKIAHGGGNTSGTAPFGDFTSNGFHIDIEKEIILLKGKVETNFDPQKIKKQQ